MTVINFDGHKLPIKSLLTFDEVMESDMKIDPELFDRLNARLGAIDEKDINAREPIIKDVMKASKEMRAFIAAKLTEHVEVPPEVRKKMSFPQAMIIYQLLYKKSVDIPENLELPSELRSSSD